MFILLLIPGFPLSAKFSGPYVMDKILSGTDYVIHTPDQKQQCHVNMLKAYHACDLTSELVIISPFKITFIAMVTADSDNEVEKDPDDL